jgi:tetratricopeptide (TPR) repeat protein
MRMLGLLFVLLLASLPGARAAPFIPSFDGEALERLPIAPRDPVMGELRALQARLKEAPNDLPVAARLARLYLDLSRSTSDPRYIGYAQAALAPWWASPHPPAEVLLLRATARQRLHLFDAALADLDALLVADPRNAQAHLTRAIVLQVIGALEPARMECGALVGGNRLLRAACLANVAAATGRLREAYDLLRSELEASASAAPRLRGFAQISLAEMAARMSDVAAAETHFRAALAIDPDDPYLLGAYADLLLDDKRPAEVETLLKGRERADPLLLRLALAARLGESETLAERVAQLRDRFAASRLRGDTAHQREEARFALSLLDDPSRALRLALENWRVQKEPADLRILIEAAVAAGDSTALGVARAWLDETRLEYAHIRHIISNAAHPN